MAALFSDNDIFHDNIFENSYKNKISDDTSGSTINVPFATTGSIADVPRYFTTTGGSYLTVMSGTGTQYYTDTNNQIWVNTNGCCITINTTGTVGYSYENYDGKEIKKNIIKQTIKSNLTILIKNNHRQIHNNHVSLEEIKARNTLRDIISEEEYRRYLTNGFLMIKGQTAWYQVFNNQQHIKVYKKGKIIEEICIHTDAKCPPTDHILNMKFLIEFDENMIRKNGNIYTKNTKNYYLYNQENISKKTIRLIDIQYDTLSLVC